MLLRSVSGATIEVTDEAAPIYIRGGFIPVAEEAPKPKKTTATRKRTTRKAAPKE